MLSTWYPQGSFREPSKAAFRLVLFEDCKRIVRKGSDWWDPEVGSHVVVNDQSTSEPKTLVKAKGICVNKFPLLSVTISHVSRKINLFCFKDTNLFPDSINRTETLGSSESLDATTHPAEPKEKWVVKKGLIVHIACGETYHHRRRYNRILSSPRNHLCCYQISV